MNYYKETIKKIEDQKYLISMVPVDEILRFGYEAELNENHKVLYLGYGYGTTLKVLSEAYGISGVCVERAEWFVSIGNERLKQAGLDNKVKLVCDDALKYADAEKYDMVICNDLFDILSRENTAFEYIQKTLAVGEKFLKKGGVLGYYKTYSKIPNPPKELTDFEGELLTLSELNGIFNKLGYCLKCMASDTDAMWEHYAINGFANGNEQNNIDRLIENPNDTETKQSVDDWNKMYFDYRRPYEGQALFGLIKIK